MNANTLIQKLRKEVMSLAGDNLPAEIRYQDRYGNLVEKPLLDATLDEVAFAIQTLNAESASIHRRRSALDSLYTMARENGCLGSDTVGAVAVEVTK